VKKLFCLVSLLFLNISFAQNYTVYGVKQELPMGEKDEVIKKNFYLSIGKEQGVYPGIVMDVFRTLFIINGANTLEKINQRVKIGELRVIHAEDKASVAIRENFLKGKEGLAIDFNDFMIGDEVSPKISSK